MKKLQFACVVYLFLLMLPGMGTAPVQAQAGSRTYPETGKTVRGVFLQYWDTHGGLAQQGFPVSEEMQEVSDTNGKVYTVQYFERAGLENHPEKQRPYDVLLSHLGTFRWRGKYETQANCGSPILPGLWTGQLTWGFTMSGSSIGGNGEVSGPVRLNVACDGTFSGTVQITTYTTRIGSGNLAILTCSQSQVTIADVAGRVERVGGEKRLNILGGLFKQGVYTCVNPIAPARPTNVTGNTVPPTMVEIEQESRNKISGKQWVPDPAYVSMIEQFRTAYRDVNIVYTGQWELNRQEVNTP